MPVCFLSKQCKSMMFYININLHENTFLKKMLHLAFAAKIVQTHQKNRQR